MPYIANTETDRQEMMKAIGVASIGDLFLDVPIKARYPKVNLPLSVSEKEILDELYALATKNSTFGCYAPFLGAGAYNHFIPSVISSLAGRGEFYTSYTPYQPEVSQGTLQAVFEYQSMMAELTAMDVVNASHYDGATAMAEAAIMAVNASRGKRRKIIVSPTIHPEYRQVLRTYLDNEEWVVKGDAHLGITLDKLVGMLDAESACLIVQNPDFLGNILNYAELAGRVHAAGALLIVATTPIISLGLLKPPGAYGADIVVAEGQPLGNPLNFGGPYLGVMACRRELVRLLPGRLIGQTIDTDGKRGFVMTLVAREQHIRREKATSNICSNQGLVALIAAMYLAYMGKHGLRAVAEQCYHKAHYAASEIGRLGRYEVVNSSRFFNEFVIRCPQNVVELNRLLLKVGIIGGFDLGKVYPNMADHMLLCVTEMNTKEQIDRLVNALKEVGK